MRKIYWVLLSCILSLLIGNSAFVIRPESAWRATPSNAAGRKGGRLAATASDATASNAGQPGASGSVGAAGPAAFGTNATESNATESNATESNASESNATDSNATDSNAVLLMELQPYGLILDEESIVVYDYDELKEAITGSNTFTTIYLGDDIVTARSGITIPSTKASLIIDGQPPGMAEDERHTLTQYTATSQSYTIRVESGNLVTKEVVLRNMDIVGGNYYGIVSVDAKDVTLIHENVRYTGPQPVYNRGGTAHFINSTYDIASVGSSSANELAEARHAIFEGEVVVRVPATTNAVLNLTDSTSTITLRAGSDITVDTSYYFTYTNGNQPKVVMETGASFSLVSRRYGFTYAGHSIGTFTMAEDARLYINLNTTESYAGLRISELFQMQPGSRTEIVRTGTDGISLRLTAAGARVEFNRPERVFLYSSAGVPLRFTNRGTLSLTTSALNLWNRADWPLAASTDQPPGHIWNKAGKEPLTVSGTYNDKTNTALTHNLSAEDPITSELNAANFNLENNQLLAFGENQLALEPVTAASRRFTGTALPAADLRATYLNGDNQAQTVTGSADSNGFYKLELVDTTISPDDDIWLLALKDRLYIRQKQRLTDETGSLSFRMLPDKLPFGTPLIPSQSTLVPRADESFRILIGDNRLNPAPWRLDVSLNRPFHPSKRSDPPELLPELLYMDENQTATPLSEYPLTVYRQEYGAAGDYQVEWAGDKGLMLRINPGNLYSEQDYTAEIIWTIVDAP